MTERRCRNGGKSWPFHAGHPTAQDYTTEPIVVAIKREFAEEVSALAALLDEGLVEMTHTGGCMCDGTRKLTAACVSDTMTRYPRGTL
jgi:hypothetical protein